MHIVKKQSFHEEAILEDLIRENYPKIYAYLYRRCYDANLAKDLTQETFCAFYRHLNDYEERGKLLNYLYRIAMHQLNDHRKHKSTQDEELYEEQVKDSTYDGKEILQKQETTLLLRRWIQQLPEHLQNIIILRYDEELKFKDISEITGIHVSTLKSQMKLALAMLEKQAKKEGWK